MTEEAAVSPVPAAYPVTYDVEPQRDDRNRLTVGFRFILSIPHILLVGSPGGIGAGVIAGSGGIAFLFSNGVLGAAAFVTAIISWFAIVFTGNHPRGLWDFARFYMRWRTKAISYIALLRDEYPPFGEGEYQVTYEVEYPEQERDRLSVGLRLIYVIPHAIILFFLAIAWVVTAVIGWFAILFTGSYPEGLYRFAVRVLRWSVRVESYVLLMRDEYPPFSLD